MKCKESHGVRLFRLTRVGGSFTCQRTAKKTVSSVLVAAIAISGCSSSVPDDPWEPASRKLCKLESDLRSNGLVTVKRPDVWTENRLYPYRREFEDVFKSVDLKGFKPKLNASEAAVQTQRLGMYLNAAMEVERIRADKGPGLGQFLALAVLQNTVPGQQMNPAQFNTLLQAATKSFIAQQSGLDPAMFEGLLDEEKNDDEVRQKDESQNDSQTTDSQDADSTESTDGQGDDAAGAEGTETAQSDSSTDQPTTGKEQTPAGGSEAAPTPYTFTWLTDKIDAKELLKVPEVSGTIDLLSPFEEQKQKRAFVQQNHMFRIGNEPDDGTRMNGYRLYYMRFMVSVTPGEKTKHGHSAEVMLTPTYPVAEAARDWVAQYVRGMLRESIMRVVELGLERAIGNTLVNCGKNTLDWDDQREVTELVESMKRCIVRVKDYLERKEWEPISAEFDSATTSLTNLRKKFTPDVKAAHVILGQIDGDLAKLKKDCEGTQKSREVARDKAHKEGEASNALSTLAAPMKVKDFSQYLQNKNFVQLEGLAPQIRDENQKEYLRLLATAKEASEGKEKADQDADRYLVDSAVSMERLVKSLNSLGAQQDEDAAAYAHDVGTKLRNEYLGIMRLAQLAYDELSREVDAGLGVPNAVPLPGERSDRAREALCDVVAQCNDNNSGSVTEGEGNCPPLKLKTDLSNMVEFQFLCQSNGNATGKNNGASDSTPNNLEGRDYTADRVGDALKKLADRVSEYQPPTKAFARLYADTLTHDEKSEKKDDPVAELRDLLNMPENKTEADKSSAEYKLLAVAPVKEHDSFVR